MPTNSPSRVHAVVKRLLLIRGLRSLGQGAMVVDLVLYLKDLHWSGAAIGGVTSAAGLVGAALILMVGVLSDRLGRKRFLFVYEFLVTASAVLMSLTTQAAVLVGAIVIAGFGRGQSGGAGPFAPAEQAWLAQYVTQEHRGRIFSYNSAIGFTGMAIGSILAGWPSISAASTPLPAYRPIFIMVGILSVGCIILISRTEEVRGATLVDPSSAVSMGESDGKVASPSEPDSIEVASRDSERAMMVRESFIRRQENIAMLKYASLNVLNGLAVGLTGPMMVYWFSLRFGAYSGEIGLTMSAGFLVTAVFSVVNGRLAQRYGMVRTVTGMRLIGSSLMAVLPWLPTFGWASVLYTIRSGLNRGTIGNRTALIASLTRDNRRGLAVSLNALSMRLPSSIGPTISGLLFDAGWVNLPLYLTAILQVVNAGLYQSMFGHYDGRTRAEDRAPHTPSPRNRE